MTNTYYDKQKIFVRIATELSTRGWKIEGFKADKSDLMTDYWDPASWSGYAIKGEFLISAGAYDSGRPLYETQNIDQQCRRCKGTGALLEGDIDTITQRYQLLVFGGAMQEIPAKHAVGDTCPQCEGAGHRVYREPVEIGRHPYFEGPSKGQSWSLERRQADGTFKRINQGRLYDIFKSRNREDEATSDLVDTMEACTRSTMVPTSVPTMVDSVGLVTGVMVRHNTEQGGVEIIFPSKPNAETLTNIKAAGFRWSSRSKVWYAKYSEAKWATAHTLAGLPLPSHSIAC